MSINYRNYRRSDNQSFMPIKSILYTIFWLIVFIVVNSFFSRTPVFDELYARYIASELVETAATIENFNPTKMYEKVSKYTNLETKIPNEKMVKLISNNLRKYNKIKLEISYEVDEKNYTRKLYNCNLSRGVNEDFTLQYYYVRSNPQIGYSHVNDRQFIQDSSLVLGTLMCLIIAALNTTLNFIRWN